MFLFRAFASPLRIANRHRRITALVAPIAVLAMGAAVVLPTTVSGAAQAPVGLGTATSFAVLAGAGITNTGPTTISGDRGTFPTFTETGTASIVQASGVDNAGNAVTQSAKDDLVIGYNTAAGAPSTSVPVELGAGKTFLPGVYNAGTLAVNGTMTLDTGGDPNAVFIFKAASTLTTGTGSQVIFLNGATSCNVFWQIGTSATLGTGSTLQGSVLALTSITATTGASILNGRLLARNGAVTLDTNTITRPVCAAAATTTTVASGVTTTTRAATTTTTPAGSGAPSTTVPPVAAPAPGAPAVPGTPGTPATPGTPTPGLPHTL